MKQVFLLAALAFLTLYVDDHVDNNGIDDFHDEFNVEHVDGNGLYDDTSWSTSTTTMTTSTTSPAIPVRRPP